MPEILEESKFNKDYKFEVRCNECTSLIKFEINELDYLPYFSRHIDELYDTHKGNDLVAKCPVSLCKNYIDIHHIPNCNKVYVGSLVFDYNKYSQFIGRKFYNNEWTNYLLYNNRKLSYNINDVKIYDKNKYSVKINDKSFIITKFLSKEDKEYIDNN